MAQTILLRHKESGVIRTGYVGFSWTTFLFGPLPALFRQDFLTFISFVVISLILAGITHGVANIFASFAWAFMYNRYYTRKLLERGYALAENGAGAAYAAMRLGVV